MSSPACVTIARTESFVSVSMPCTSSKFPPPVGETCETNESKPVESPAHNSCNMGPDKISLELESNVQLVLEIIHTSPVKGLPTESFARIFWRSGHASSTSRQFGSKGAGGDSKEKIRFNSGRHWWIDSLVWKCTGRTPLYHGGLASRPT